MLTTAERLRGQGFVGAEGRARWVSMQRRSVVLAVVLAVLLGPIGAIYGARLGGLALSAAGLAAGAWGLWVVAVALWPVAVVIAGFGAHSHNLDVATDARILFPDSAHHIS